VVALALALAVGLGGSAYGEETDDRHVSEPEVVLPAPPRAENLIPVYVAANSTNQFLLDGASLRVEGNGVILYTIVIKSPGATTTVNFEGVRCSDWQRRIFALGRSDGTWSRARSSAWGKIGGSGPNGYPYVLYRNYFCRDGVPLRTGAEGIEALKRGEVSNISPGS
jgi:hypothetical protein